MKKAQLLTIILTFLELGVLFSQTTPTFRNEDKIRIETAIDISNRYGDSIWTGINDFPFTILFVTAEWEYLINHPNPTSDFVEMDSNLINNQKIYFRPRVFSPHLLATFPAINGINTVVVGTPENTGLKSTPWIITLLHEHFHQFQYNSATFHQDALDLGLSGGDETGMWQLNYPFPYRDVNLNKIYLDYTIALQKAVRAIDDDSFNDLHLIATEKKSILRNAMDSADFKYLDFQWYQEGVARYTEYAFLRQLNDYKPAPELTQLVDFEPFEKYRQDFYDKHIKNIVELNLSENGRETVYDVGFGECLILDRISPNWKRYYLRIKFNLEKLKGFE